MTTPLKQIRIERGFATAKEARDRCSELERTEYPARVRQFNLPTYYTIWRSHRGYAIGVDTLTEDC